jgi:hypothetical protein
MKFISFHAGGGCVKRETMQRPGLVATQLGGPARCRSAARRSHEALFDLRALGGGLNESGRFV